MRRNDPTAVAARGYLLDPTRLEHRAYWLATDGPRAEVRTRHRHATVTVDVLGCEPFPDPGLAVAVLRWATLPAGTMTHGPTIYATHRATPARACVAAQTLVELWYGNDDGARTVLAGRPFGPVMLGLPDVLRGQLAEVAGRWCCDVRVSVEHVHSDPHEPLVIEEAHEPGCPTNRAEEVPW